MVLLVPALPATQVFAGVVVAAVTLMIAFLVLTGSLAFYVGRSETGEMGFHAMLLLGAYPVDMFAGVAKLLLHTVIPAAFVSTVPARLVDSFDGGQALGLVASAVTFAVAAWLAFTFGLRRYTSGSVWTRA